MTPAHTDRPTPSSGVQLAEVVAAIALAADLGLGQPLDHVLRSCVIATRFAEQLGVSQADRDAAYWVTLFVTAGCTGVSFELSRVFGDDIAFRAGVFSVGASPFQQLWYLVTRAGSHRSALGRAVVLAGLLRTRMSALEQSFLAHCAVSAQEIHKALSQEGRAIGIASVYRSLEALHGLQLVQRFDAGHGEGLYEPVAPSGEHHHHVVCDDCDRIMPFEDPALERAIDKLAKRVPYAIAGHDVVLHGRCPDCQKN